MKKYLLMAAMATAVTAFASDSLTGTYLMTSYDDYGSSKKSEVTISETATPGIVEVTGLIDSSTFDGTVLTAEADEENGTLSFASGQTAMMWGMDVTLTMLEETDEDFVPAEGAIVARRGDDGRITFEGIWGFLYGSDVYYVVTEAFMVLPNADFSFMYMHYTGDVTEQTVALGVDYAENVLTIDGFSPISVDPISTMKFNVDAETHTASLVDPETPNATGWSGERYLCTITKFNNDFYNPEIEFEKGLVCAVEDGKTLVFPNLWGIISINPNEPNAAPGLTGLYKSGRLSCRFQLYDTTGVEMIGADSDVSAAAYYDLQGRRLAAPQGICIMVRGGKARKVLAPTAR